MFSQETHLQFLLGRLRTRLLFMCAAVEKAVGDACDAFCEGNTELANAVIEADGGIDALENEVDEMALLLLACSQPVARDLRFVVGALRMVLDLERIGDEAAVIAKRALLLREEPRRTLVPMRRMMDKAQHALSEAIAAFRGVGALRPFQTRQGKEDMTQLEVGLLQSVMRGSGGADGQKDAADEAVLHVVLAARSLARIFGRASNIVEHCYFMEQGVNINHKASLR